MKECTEKLQTEDERAAAEGLSEAEKVKNAAKHLLETLQAKETRRTLLTPDRQKTYSYKYAICWVR